MPLRLKEAILTPQPLSDHLHDILAYSASVTEALSENDELKRKLTLFTDAAEEGEKAAEPGKDSDENGEAGASSNKDSSTVAKNKESVEIPRSDSPDIM